MTEHPSETIERLRKKRKSQNYLNSFMVVGIVALSAAVAILYLRGENVADTAQAVVGQAQQSLRVTCPAAEQMLPALPATARRDCEAARKSELTDRIAKVVDEPDPNDPEAQDPEIQDPEVQDSETQDPEIQDPETQDPDEQETEVQDPEVQESEEQDPEVQESEIQDPEEQNAPVCPPGYSQQPFHYFGPDGVEGGGDDEDWLLCKKVI